MKESKVHLVSAALAKNKNQDHFYTNHHLEFLEEQTSVNHHLMNSISQLDQSCKTILSEIRIQNQALNKLNNNHKYDYVNLKKILFNLAQTTRGYGSHLQKQEYTLQNINEHLDKQSKVNELNSKRAINHEKGLNQLQGSLNRQRNFLNNFAFKQDSSFDNIKHQLGYQKEANVELQNRLDIQQNSIQNILEEQKQFSTIVSNYSEEQNRFHEIQENKEIFNNLQSQLVHQEEAFNLFQEQFYRQKEVINDLSENQNSQLKAQNHFHKQLSEKQQLSEVMGELILEEIKLQITQQDDIYNYLQDSLNRQQGFLLQLSDNQNRQLEKITNNLKSHQELNKKSMVKQDSLIQLNEHVLDNIVKQCTQQEESLKEIKELIEKTLYSKGNIGTFLSKLPPN
ncbi:hypothetical protein KD050_12855 [Psychrobacillus sp. INOP01]|uniref:hypothetical protein n=1 Tax=Psychrobacillus sp. INOP01 TaxID=2829187 RepID=UPI001BA53B95|nr:hypothetical protein [Psychrobacillus sp. INOP01]QUG40194.1 hypothetical protein KD050_12855 [Psychrobacillus sp. INOP01]